MKKYILSLVLCFGFITFLSAQDRPDPGIPYDINEIKIQQNKSVVTNDAKKKLTKLCPSGFEIKWTELYKNSVYKLHFTNKCGQSGEVHYRAVSGDYIKTICD